MRLRLVPLVVVVAALSIGCASTTAFLEDAQASLESHRGRYMRICCEPGATSAATCKTPSPEPSCVKYGKAVNALTDAIDDADPALDSGTRGGSIPSSAKARVKRAKDDVEKAKP